MASWPGRKRGNCPLNFWLSKNCRKIFFLSENFCPEMQKLKLKTLFQRNLMAKLTFAAVRRNTVTNVSVCGKIATSCFAYFCLPTTPLHLVTCIGTALVRLRRWPFCFFLTLLSISCTVQYLHCNCLCSENRRG